MASSLGLGLPALWLAVLVCGAAKQLRWARQLKHCYAAVENEILLLILLTRYCLCRLLLALSLLANIMLASGRVTVYGSPSTNFWTIGR